MKRLLSISLLVFSFAVVARSQAECVNATFPGHCNGTICVSSSNQAEGCQDTQPSGCMECNRGFMEEGGNRSSAGYFTVGFNSGAARVGLPGPLARYRVQTGDTIYRINARRVTPASIQRWTRERPVRYAEARWDSQGRLHLRLWR